MLVCAHCVAPGPATSIKIHPTYNQGRTMSEVTKGRPFAVNPLSVAGWRQTRNASIARTATHYGISRKTVSNYCRDYREQAQKNREVFRLEKIVERLDREIAEGERYLVTYEILRQRHRRLLNREDEGA